MLYGKLHLTAGDSLTTEYLLFRSGGQPSSVGLKMTDSNSQAGPMSCFNTLGSNNTTHSWMITSGTICLTMATHTNSGNTASSNHPTENPLWNGQCKWCQQPQGASMVLHLATVCSSVSTSCTTPSAIVRRASHPRTPSHLSERLCPTPSLSVF